MAERALSQDIIAVVSDVGEFRGLLCLRHLHSLEHRFDICSIRCYLGGWAL